MTNAIRISGVSVLGLSSLLLIGACQTTLPLRNQTNFTQQQTQGDWQVQKGTPQPRYNLQANAIGNAIYVTGGFNDQDILETFERFDPQTQTWTALPMMPVPRYIHTASVLNQQVYAIGGYNFAQKTDNLIQSFSQAGALQPNPVGRGAIKQVDRFDPQTGQWSAVAPLQTERFMAMSETLGGKIYVAGGGDLQRRMLDSIEAYDPKTQQWQVIGKLPVARAWGQLLSDGQSLFLIGGLNAGGIYTGQIDRYDTKTGKWQLNALPPLPEGRAGFAAAWTAQGIVVTGGTNPNGFQQQTLLLKPGESQWQNLPDLVPGRAGLDLVATPNGLYAFGTDAWYTNNTLKLDL